MSRQFILYKKKPLKSGKTISNSIFPRRDDISLICNCAIFEFVILLAAHAATEDIGEEMMVRNNWNGSQATAVRPIF